MVGSLKKKLMKKITLIFSISIAFLSSANAQIQQGNILIGGDLADFNLTLGGGGAFSASLVPKAAFFIKDNVALGAYINFGLTTSKGGGTTTNYGVGALGRYYLSDPNVNVLNHGRLFFEGNVGIEGISVSSSGRSTNGLGIGVGPGYAYFLTPNIGLEVLLKYDGIVGFGSEPYTSNLDLNLGFQIYLPGKKLKSIANDVK